jgi:hypothetical protein
MKTTNLIYPTFAVFALACFALSQQAQAVCQEGCDLVNGNTFLGDNALSNNTGILNTAIGSNSLSSNTTGNFNTATGADVLVLNTTGFSNTAYGEETLPNNTIGVENTAVGVNCLFNNTEGNDNIAIGNSALQSNTTGDGNVAVGQGALIKNTTADNNTATGTFALTNNTTGFVNAAFGYQALYSNTEGIANTAVGDIALFNNTIGSYNTAYGNNSLANNTTGSFNTALGDAAGVNLTTGSNNIDISNYGVAGESKTIRIGTKGTQTKTFIAGIGGVTVSGGTAVYIKSNGQLGTVTSSRRFKDKIKPMDATSEALLALKPVTFRYKQHIDPDRVPQFGLVAEEVEKVNPDLVLHDDDGKPYSVRYEAVNAMLLNEFLKAHDKIDNLEAVAAKQQKEIASLTAQLKEQSAQIRKVNDKVEMTKPAPQLVTSDR